MKQSFLLLVMFLMVASQGFAQQKGSWSILPGQIDYREGSGSDDNDGTNHSDPTDCGGFDGMVSVTDLVNPGNTEGTNSVFHKLWISYPSNGEASISDVVVNTKKTFMFIISSEYIKRYTLSIVGEKEDKAMYSLETNSINVSGLWNMLNPRTVRQAVDLYYKPTSPGIHTVNVVIKEKGGSATCTLKVVGSTVKEIITSKKNLNFDSQNTAKTFRVYGHNLTSSL